ncbi:DUF2703 domain-containing protein [Anoxynatronum buryatiense]|uniref:Uncharacterized protein n=1 Tax=Anoxynatronum buryatiense TaxID=489973 RepID=A0AA46AK87_9CLOT|nr:DUF2703 domain-containing protein [Anoxynatronum buryatiense]SMP68628.1 protein of unknown function [Anoxynatronum buryatiense]
MTNPEQPINEQTNGPAHETASGTDRHFQVDFLYLDLTICNRCQEAETNLEEALAEVEETLKVAGIQVTVNRVNVNTEALARQHRFVSSPTIRINGSDIQQLVQESQCHCCGDLCGDEVDCRVWLYRGQIYEAPPRAMIMEALLKEVYGGNACCGTPAKAVAGKPYELPENLKRFYDAMAKQPSLER